MPCTVSVSTHVLYVQMLMLMCLKHFAAQMPGTVCLFAHVCIFDVESLDMVMCLFMPGRVH